MTDRHPTTGRYLAHDCETDCQKHCAGLCAARPVTIPPSDTTPDPT